MFPITLEPQQQINLFLEHSKNASDFELEVVNKRLTAEIRLYFLTGKKEKVVRQTKRQSISKHKQYYYSSQRETLCKQSD